MTRIDQLEKFYEYIGELTKKFPIRTLAGINSKNLPKCGVYFFFEPDEFRGNKEINRVVRVGTHAVQQNSKATLYQRLSTHKGPLNGKGKHRMSVQRELIGFSLMNKHFLQDKYPYWGQRTKKGDKSILQSEEPLELSVTDYINIMPFTVIEINGASSKTNHRSYIETNSIALLSNYRKPIIDPPSPYWLGQYSTNQLVKESGLWNRKDVNKIFNEDYFDLFYSYIKTMGHY